MRGQRFVSLGTAALPRDSAMSKKGEKDSHGFATS